MEQNHAKGGTIVVMDPHTGDVYAMATYPVVRSERVRLRPTARASSTGRSRTRGSRAPSTRRSRRRRRWRSGAVTPTQRFDGSGDPPGRGVHDPRRRAARDGVDDARRHHRALEQRRGLPRRRSQVGNADDGNRPSRGSATAPRPVSGSRARPPGSCRPSRWSALTRATVSFGAGVAVTPLQMASVYATIANGGTWVQPRLVDATVGPDGVAATMSLLGDPAGASTGHRAHPHADARDTWCRTGPVSSAQIPGYQVAGKTGTAKKLDPSGRYVNRYVASFIGFLPASRPRVVVAVIIDEPRTVYGGVAAAPVFQEVARYAIQRLGIEPAPAGLAPAARDARPMSRRRPACRLAGGGASPSRRHARARRPRSEQRCGVTTGVSSPTPRTTPGTVAPGSLFFCIPGDQAATVTVRAGGARGRVRAPSSSSGGSTSTCPAGPRPVRPRSDGPDVRRDLRAARRGR